ncbi:MAG: alpha/beta hydrolase [Desulfovibrio sp.]|nr:alpha/beta hydrolase [Desulfovibrio sp.]
MRYVAQIKNNLLLVTLLLHFLLASAPGAANAREERPLYPTPESVSPELKRFITQKPLFSYWNAHPKDAEEWRLLVSEIAASTKKVLPALREKLGVRSEKSCMASVPVFTLTPKDLPDAHKNCVILHIHGGGYVLYPGESGTGEGVILSGLGKFKVVSVDYRMPPDHPYPAALDDVVTVYRELLKDHDPSQLAVFGSSTGGGLTLALIHRAKKEGLPLPAAIAPGSPWSDMSKTGDTYFTNAHLDNVLVSYEGWLKDAALLYANGRSLKDPFLSPIYGDFSGFPPTFLTSGTRDLFLSNTVRTHLKLREAGVLADLVVFEGMSHVTYVFDPDMPETRLHCRLIGEFFDRCFSRKNMGQEKKSH